MNNKIPITRKQIKEWAMNRRKYKSNGTKYQHYTFMDYWLFFLTFMVGIAGGLIICKLGAM
jgi:hypothetical protein